MQKMNEKLYLIDIQFVNSFLQLLKKWSIFTGKLKEANAYLTCKASKVVFLSAF